MQSPSVPIYTDDSISSEGVGCVAVFPDFEVFISLPVVASIFRAELCAIFLALSRISFYDSDSFVVYSDSRSALQALGNFYARNPLVLKFQYFLCDLHARRNFVYFCWIPSHVGFSGNERLMFWPKGPSNYPQPIIMLYPSGLHSLHSPFHPCLLAVPLGPVCCRWQ